MGTVFLLARFTLSVAQLTAVYPVNRLVPQTLSVQLHGVVSVPDWLPLIHPRQASWSSGLASGELLNITH